MGGRRSYSIKDVVGSKRKLSKDIQKLNEAIKSQKSEKIVEASTKLITKSDYSLKNLAKSVKLLDFVISSAEKKPVSYEYGKKLASETWSEIKKHEKIELPHGIDRIFVDSAAKAIRRKKNE